MALCILVHFAIFCLCVFAAGGIEASGISYARSNRLFKAKIGNVDVTAVRLSIFVQIPQYFFLALSEVLTPLTGMYFNLCTFIVNIIFNILYVVSCVSLYLSFLFLQCIFYSHGIGNQV